MMCMFVYLYNVSTVCGCVWVCVCVVWTCLSACMSEYCLRFV